MLTKVNATTDDATSKLITKMENQLQKDNEIIIILGAIIYVTNMDDRGGYIESVCEDLGIKVNVLKLAETCYDKQMEKRNGEG